MNKSELNTVEQLLIDECDLRTSIYTDLRQQIIFLEHDIMELEEKINPTTKDMLFAKQVLDSFREANR